MKYGGLTGGMGSGKSTVALIFEALGVAVYYADERAKALYEKEEVAIQLRHLMGDEVFDNGRVNTKKLAGLVFGSQEKLEALNGLIHREVALDFESWAERQSGAYVLKEAAILFETGSYKKMDFNILVVAPEALRIKRVMARNGWSLNEIKSRLEKQWNDEQKRALAHYVIENQGEALIPQVLKLHFEILKSCKP